MGWKVEVAANADASSWTDITAYVVSESARFGGQASRFSVGTGSSFELEDDAGTRYVPGRRVIRVTEDETPSPTQLFRGRVSIKELARGVVPTGDAKRITVQLDDYNQDLWGIIVDGQDRPEESATTRMLWLIAKYLDGQPGVGGRKPAARESTVLDDTYVAAGLRNVPADEIFDGSPGQVAADILSTTGLEGFVTVDGEVFLDDPTSTAYAADISISDTGADGFDIYAPIPDGSATEDPTELVTGLKAKYGTGDHTSVSARDPSVVATYDKWEEVIRFGTKNQVKAQRRVNTLLAQQSVEEKRRVCAIKIRADQVHRIKPGQTISYRWAASGDTTPVTLRISRLLWELPTVPGEAAPYIAHLELTFPKKVEASLGGGGGAPGGNGGPDPYVSPSPTGIAGQATLHTADNDPDVDATYNYPGGSPAGRLVQGRQYKFVMDIIYNRKVPKGDGTLWDAAMEKVAMQVAETISGSHVAITGFVEPTSGPGLALEGSGELSPTKYLASTGSHWESMWYTYDEVGGSQDFDIVLGAHATGFYGEETVALCTVYERTADLAPPVPASGGGPTAGQQVGPEVAPPGDGVRTTDRTSFSYLAGSLRVHVNGLDWTTVIIPSGPDTGDYGYLYPPSLGSTIVRYYQRGITVASGSVGGGTGDGAGGAGSPSVPTGPATSPELPDTPVNDGPSATPGDLQALIDAASEGDVLVLDKKEWLEDVTIDTFGLTIDFSGGTINAEGSRSMWIDVRAHNVTLMNLLCVDAAPDTASAEKSPQTGSLSCNGWNGLTLRNVHLRSGRDAGLYLQHSADTSVIACSSNDNPRSGASIGNVPNLRILDSQFNDNLTDATYSPLWEGGGYKIGGSGATNILIERTECSGNAGVGHWIDEHPSNVVIRDCWGHDNAYSGLMFEISTGGSIIRWRGWENGWDDTRGDDPGSGDWGWGADVLISSAGTVDVVGPICAWSSAGITRINQGDRSNRESTVRLTGSGAYVACDDDRRVSSWHQDGSGNQILTTDASNHDNDLTWYCASGEFFNWDGDVSAAAFAATRGGVGLTEITLVAMQAVLSAADIGGVAGVGMPTAGTH